MQPNQIATRWLFFWSNVWSYSYLDSILHPKGPLPSKVSTTSRVGPEEKTWWWDATWQRNSLKQLRHVRGIPETTGWLTGAPTSPAAGHWAVATPRHHGKTSNALAEGQARATRPAAVWIVQTTLAVTHATWWFPEIGVAPNHPCSWDLSIINQPFWIPQ